MICVGGRIRDGGKLKEDRTETVNSGRNKENVDGKQETALEGLLRKDPISLLRNEGTPGKRRPRSETSAELCN